MKTLVIMGILVASALLPNQFPAKEKVFLMKVAAEPGARPGNSYEAGTPKRIVFRAEADGGVIYGVLLPKEVKTEEQVDANLHPGEVIYVRKAHFQLRNGDKMEQLEFLREATKSEANKSLASSAILPEEAKESPSGCLAIEWFAHEPVVTAK